MPILSLAYDRWAFLIWIAMSKTSISNESLKHSSFASVAKRHHNLQNFHANRRFCFSTAIIEEST